MSWSTAASSSLSNDGIVRKGEVIELTPVGFRMLREMLSTPGRFYSRCRLIGAIYEDHRVVSDRTIDSRVRNLRHKLRGAEANDGLIRSRYGLSYGVARSGAVNGWLVTSGSTT